MSEELLIMHSSPTLAGIKTGSLFVCRYAGRGEMLDEVRTFNRRLSAKGIVLLALKYSDGRALLYLYRPAKLESDLNDALAIRLLESLGYDSTKIGRCISQLMRRFGAGGEFPHEVGLFLGYPPDDVQGFIENKGHNYKCVGCWKVYGDEQMARKRFDSYRACTRVYSEQYAKGKSIERLTVAV